MRKLGYSSENYCRQLFVLPILGIVMAFVPSVSFSAYQTGAVELSEQASTLDIPVLAIGAVSDIDAAASSIVVNGQNILIDSTTAISGRSEAGYELALGDYVIVAGELIEAGTSLATVVLYLDESYVPGVSPAHVRAIVEAVNAETGIAISGNTTIDQNGLAGQIDSVVTGDVVEFSGYAYGQHFVAVEASVSEIEFAGIYVVIDSSLSSLNGLRGSGVRGLRGSGVRGLRGSGVRGLRGSGVR